MYDQQYLTQRTRLMLERWWLAGGEGAKGATDGTGALGEGAKGAKPPTDGTGVVELGSGVYNRKTYEYYEDRIVGKDKNFEWFGVGNKRN